jgi:ribonucleoside-diphosphate reductase alpha chain
MINIYAKDLPLNARKELEDITEITNDVILKYVAKCHLHPNNSLIAARLTAEQLRNVTYDHLKVDKYTYFTAYLEHAVTLGLLDERMLLFDLEALEDALILENMKLFHYMGIRTLIDRYLIRELDGTILELPQTFFLRVAMGLHLNEASKDAHITAKIVTLYKTMSSMEYIPSTPTLFNSGTNHSQLSSCFVGTVEDSLFDIYQNIAITAQLSKYSGGVGMNWNAIRSNGSYIKGVSGESQGVIPFLKVYNDTLVAVNQGGKRRGAGVAYIEPWHADIKAFLNLRKSTGEERLRCHDMNTALWLPDIFMQRVIDNGTWSLFDPSVVPQFKDLYGEAFTEAYIRAEKCINTPKVTLKATSLWQSILSTIYETGHPWLTFKDTFNRRNPQAHDGAIHSSNLCTEIGLNTSKDEIAVCNLGSINLTKFVHKGKVQRLKLKKAVFNAINALNKVIDHNFHVIDKAEKSNKKHRAIGLGSMGFHTMLQQNNIRYDSAAALKLNAELAEYIQYFSLLASNELAKQYGHYTSFPGSTWSQGILTHETATKTHINAAPKRCVPQSAYTTLKRNIIKYGLRNCTLTAIAPTATISNLCNVSQSYEPIYSNLFSKSNLSGVFSVINTEMFHKHNLSTQEVNSLVNNEGKSANPLFVTAFDVPPEAIIRLAADRQLYVDQAISTNIYFDSLDGNLLADIYINAWKAGLKSTYYLRSKAASSIDVYSNSTPTPQVCTLDEGCESCQ